MSIAAQCNCGKSIYCVGGDGCTNIIPKEYFTSLFTEEQRDQFAAEFAEWKDKNFTMLGENDRKLWYKEKGKGDAPIPINDVLQLFKQSKPQ